MRKALMPCGTLMIALSLSCIAQVEVGEIAPVISVEKWIDNPDYETRKIKNKAVVLDFWFTNCAPCVYTIPHLNELSEQYNKDEVAFAAITFNDETTIKNFLSKRSILANIGSDTSYQTIHAFGVELYPTTFLIDNRGILRWKGHPSQLTSDMIDVLINKKYYPGVIIYPEIKPTSQKIEFDPDFVYPIEVRINDYMEGGHGMLSNSTELSIVNKELVEIMAILLKKSYSEIAVHDHQRYDVRFKIQPEIPDEMVFEKVTESLLLELGYQLKTENRTVDGFEMRLIDNGLFIQNAIDTTKVYQGMNTSATQTQWQGSGIFIKILISELEGRFDIAIKDETQLNGFFELDFPTTSFQEARSYLFKKFGLSLNPAKVQVEISIIENKY